MMTTRYWIGVASHDHVKRGVTGNFCQLCHGKAQPLKRMSVGDWLIYYSPKEQFEKDIPCQEFMAIGEVVGSDVYAFQMAPGFIPNRRDIHFLPAQATPIRPLIDQLAFIKNKQRWGYAFRFGHMEISKQDFELIANNMLGSIPTTRKK